MNQTWPVAIEFALNWEKEWSPGDGGTWWGITNRFYPKDFAKMSPMLPEQRKIYAKEFWHREFWMWIKGDSLSYPLDWVIFECSVNPGPVLARKLLSSNFIWQQALLERMRYYWNLHQPGRIDGEETGWLNRALNLYEAITRTIK